MTTPTRKYLVQNASVDRVRRATGWTYSRIAVELGISRRTLYKWRHGDVPTVGRWALRGLEYRFRENARIERSRQRRRERHRADFSEPSQTEELDPAVEASFL